jgi:hypothetical protein
MNDAIKSSLDQLNTEEIVKKVAHSMLTKDAHAIALGILKGRGVNTVDLPIEPDENFHKSNFFKQKFPYLIAIGILALFARGYYNTQHNKQPSNEEQTKNSSSNNDVKSVLKEIQATGVKPPIESSKNCSDNLFKDNSKNVLCK